MVPTGCIIAGGSGSLCILCGSLLQARRFAYPWTIEVFLGVGVISWVLVGTFGAMMFLWMYRNLLKVRPVQKPLSGPGTLGSSSRPIPPSSSVNG